MELNQFIIIGRYVPKASFVHLLDPRTKIFFVFYYILLTLFLTSFKAYILLLAVIILIIFLSRVNFYFYLKGLIPIILFIIVSSLFHIFMTKGGILIFEWKMISIYSEGIRQASLISIRLLLIFLSASLLTITTSPIDVTIALERLMKPLKIVRIPVSDLAFMMSISLRFIPVIIDETEKVLKAQKARGADFEKGSIIKRGKYLVSIIIPLFISSIKRADELALAMESRGYRGGEGRTRRRILLISWRDWIAFCFIMILAIIILLIRG